MTKAACTADHGRPNACKMKQSTLQHQYRQQRMALVLIDEGTTSAELDDLRAQFLKEDRGLSEVLFVDEDVPGKPIL